MSEFWDTSGTFDPSNADESLRRRYETMARQLDLVIGETHPRLSDQNQRYTVGDMNASLLRYADIVRFTPTGESPELPEGAKKCEDPRAIMTMMEHHIADVIYYLREHQSVPKHGKELAGFPVVEFQDEFSDGSHEGFSRWLHPKVEGYDWYRGLKVEVDAETAVLIFQPWMQPWREGGSPFPLLYIIGEPTSQQLSDITFSYAAS